MTIRNFRETKFKGYHYNTVKECVVSTKRGKPVEMKWTRSNWGAPKRVSLYLGSYSVSFTEDEILSKLEPAVVAASPFAEVVQGAPSFEYVMFSKKEKASQFFYSGTPIADALAKFARRGVNIDPSEVQILNVKTNQVSKLAAKVVTTYTF